MESRLHIAKEEAEIVKRNLRGMSLSMDIKFFDFESLVNLCGLEKVMNYMHNQSSN